jgi:cbb3-type cytochrome oxidase maturation protein
MLNMTFVMLFMFPFFYICAMSAIIVLITVSILVAVVFLGAFIWSVKSGQYDDTHTPSMKMLLDERKEEE